MILDPRLRRRLVESTPARSWVLDTLRQASVDPLRATSALRQASREARKLRSRERRALWDVVYDLIRHRAALEAREGCEGWEAVLDAWLADPTIPESLPDALRLGCPEPVAADLRARWGDALDDWLAASNSRAPTFLRANTARIQPAALGELLARDGIETRPAGDLGLEVIGRANLMGHAAYRDGRFEVQDLASQRIVQLVVDSSTPRVLDLCAGAGGKALGLAALGARVTATDVRRRALGELEKRARRARAKIEVLVIGAADDALGERRFDRVLVDAPCSGSGVWRRHPEFRWRFVDGELDRLTALQSELLARGATFVADGGQLVYATCSALTRENEAIVDAFLADHPGWERAADDLVLAPHLHGTDGMYAATLVRA